MLDTMWIVTRMALVLHKGASKRHLLLSVGSNISTRLEPEYQMVSVVCDGPSFLTEAKTRREPLSRPLATGPQNPATSRHP